MACQRSKSAKPATVVRTPGLFRPHAERAASETSMLVLSSPQSATARRAFGRPAARRRLGSVASPTRTRTPRWRATLMAELVASC
jgi:hypothetical protein